MPFPSTTWLPSSWLLPSGGAATVSPPSVLTSGLPHRPADPLGGATHFSLPFLLGGDGQFQTVAQDSPEDIVVAIAGVLRSRKGHRDDRPDIGISDPAHRQGGADLQEIRTALATHEPRADRLVARDPALLAQIVDYVQITQPEESA